MTKRNKPKKLNKPKELNKLNKLSYAIIGHPDDPKTWLLPHHTPELNKLYKLNELENTVDWPAMADSVALLTGIHGNRVAAPPETVIEAARHLAKHYENAKKPVPDALAVLL
jgi:hypothetical protein